MVTLGYKGLQGVKRVKGGNNGLQRAKKGYKGLRGGNKGLNRVTRDYRVLEGLKRVTGG